MRATYILRRIGSSILLFLLNTIIFFILIRMVPGDPIYAMYGYDPAIPFTKEDIERLRHQYGLDQPLPIQYWAWLQSMLRGDFGYSYETKIPVNELLRNRLFNTLLLQSIALFFSMLIGIPCGVIAAVKPHSKTDNILGAFSIFGFSMPQFWFGIILILLFSVYLGWLPTGGLHTIGGETTVIDTIRHLILPVTTLSLTYATAFMSRLTRSSMLEVLREDYILVARAKGLNEKVVIWKHALRNALLPVVTVAGLYLAFMFSGSAIIETVFAYPGVGYLMVNAAKHRDYAILMGVNVLVAIVVITSIVVTDIVYAFIDPKIRYT